MSSSATTISSSLLASSPLSLSLPTAISSSIATATSSLASTITSSVSRISVSSVSGISASSSARAATTYYNTPYALPTAISSTSGTSYVYTSSNFVIVPAAVVGVAVAITVAFVVIFCSCCRNARRQNRHKLVANTIVRTEFPDLQSRRIAIVPASGRDDWTAPPPRRDEEDREERGEAGFDDDQLPAYSPPMPQKALTRG